MSDGVLGLPAYDDREAFTNFIEAIRVAESASGQLAFYTQNPAWLKVRNALEATRELSTKLAQASMRKMIV